MTPYYEDAAPADPPTPEDARGGAITEAWQAVDNAVRPLGFDGGASNSPWNEGYERAKNEALNAILALRTPRLVPPGQRDATETAETLNGEVFSHPVTDGFAQALPAPAPTPGDEGLRARIAGHLVHGFNGSQVLCQCREGGWLTRQGYMNHLLAALPPVAGPEVRPDETPAPRDRAATDVECGMWAERIRQITATWPTPLGGSEAWEIARYAVLPHLATPAPAPGDEGLRTEVEQLRVQVQALRITRDNMNAARDEAYEALARVRALGESWVGLEASHHYGDAILGIVGAV